MILQRLQIRIRGVVQGVGFRPFVWRLATESGLSGWILNDGSGVLIEAQGTSPAIEWFLQQLQQQPPPLAQVDDCVAIEIPVQAGHEVGPFVIRASDPGSLATAAVPPDVGLCADCERELFDASNRRYRYPFINCTNCGPRFTIITALPYDRPQTTMVAFELCPECSHEYQNPADRRFHAQPNACPTCGPELWIELGRGTLLGSEAAALESDVGQSNRQPEEQVQQAGSLRRRSSGSESAIQAARDLILSGQILAIKGIGGFHLACNACDEQAVARLRQLKRRPDKPLAVMVADLETARQYARLDSAEERLLSSPQRPIMLLSRRPESQLAAAVAPGNPWIGVLLAYSPLHRLLISPGECWVMTSGNLADEPIARDNEEAMQRLAGVCDAFLLHNRPIETVCDDSVVRCCGSSPLPIRRSRGYCPLPIPLGQTRVDMSSKTSNATSDQAQPCILAVGGEIKTAVCLVQGQQAILGQHIGDMGNRETLVALERSVEHLLQLYQAKPVAIVADLHPGYLSTRWAQKFAAKREVSYLSVQHHHAHAAALMAEHGLLQETDSIIACVFDGTGYGTDGAIWGGEWLIANPLSFRRFAHLEYTPLPGGDSAIDRPSKIALAQLFQFQLPWDERLPCVTDWSEVERKLLLQQLQKKIHMVDTSSMGRLFDCVAALTGVRHQVYYEGQAASELEHLASNWCNDHPHAETTRSTYPVAWSKQSDWVLNYQLMLKAILDEVLSGIELGEMAARFHRTIAVATAEICGQARAETGIHIVGLTGGVFQNVLLTEMTRSELERAGFKVLTHSLVPPNDGGLALGQAVVGRSILPTTSSRA